MAYSNEKLKGLFNRVYTGQMQETDEQDIRDYAKKVFGNGEYNPDPSLLHQFNNLVVQQADQIAKPMVSDVVGLLATMKTANRGDMVKYDIPQKSKAKVRWSANGSGVDLVRVENKKSEIAVPRTFSTGFYYEPFGMIDDAVSNFNLLVNDIANAKLRLYFNEISKLVTAAVTASDIPSNNVLSGSNTTLANFQKLGSVLARYGGRPLFVADTLLIDYYAKLQGTDTTFKNFLSEKIKDEVMSTLNPASIGRVDAVNLVNPFIDAANSKTELPVNIGYMFAGSVTQKPFVVVEFGGLRQMTEQDMEDERIKMKIYQDADIELLFGEAIGYVKEDAAVTL